MVFAFFLLVLRIFLALYSNSLLVVFGRTYGMPRITSVWAHARQLLDPLYYFSGPISVFLLSTKAALHSKFTLNELLKTCISVNTINRTNKYFIVYISRTFNLNIDIILNYWWINKGTYCLYNFVYYLK